MILSAIQHLRVGRKRWPANEDHRMALCYKPTQTRYGETRQSETLVRLELLKTHFSSSESILSFRRQLYLSFTLIFKTLQKQLLLHERYIRKSKTGEL